MNRTANRLGVTAAFISVLLFFVPTTFGQDRRVNILRLEVDGKPVEADITVDIISADKGIHRAKSDRNGFFVPESVVAKDSKEIVGVIIKFKKHTLTFFAVHASNFNVDWSVVGLDKKPFDPELLGKSDPSEVASIHFIVFAGEPERRMITTTISKPKITVRPFD